MSFYEALWFMDHDDIIEDVFTKEFKTKKQALDYYEKHKNDPDKYGWLVTKRGHGFKPLEIYVGSVEFYDGDKGEILWKEN